MVLPETNLRQLMRMADASVNRAAEGLRYLEDVCRFSLNQTALNQRLKSIRHSVTVSSWNHQKSLIEARNAGADVGVTLEAEVDTEIPRDLISSVVANSRRVQEALRSLEETAKIMPLTPALAPGTLQQARFEIYTIEKEILGRLLRWEQGRRVNGIYVVIDTQALQGRSHIELTAQAVSGGARVIQLRDKTTDRGLLLPVAEKMKEICCAGGALFIINDYIDLALAVKADGVHLGQSDIPVRVARQMVPMEMLVGCSVATVKTAKKAQADGADYLAVNGVYPTSSKDCLKPLGVSMVKKIRASSDLPLVAIGGITLEHVQELKQAGVDAIAVISAVLGTRSPESAVRQMVRKFRGKNGKTNPKPR